MQRTPYRDFDQIDEREQCLALAEALEAIAESGYRSLDEWGRGTGRTPQEIWDEIMAAAALPRCTLPLRLRAH